MKAAYRHLRSRWTQLIEKQGFPIIVTICVCVITATALWTRKPETQPSLPAQPTQNISAAHLIQQSLQDAATPTPMPTEPPQRFSPPLDEYALLTAFSAAAMRQSGVTGIWAIHDAIDLQADQGSPVLAIADGVIIDGSQDQLQASWVRIDHGDGVEACYAGMAQGGQQDIGDTVCGGDVIGYVGSGLLTEGDLPPHLHLRITRHGAAIDPATLWD